MNLFSTIFFTLLACCQLLCGMTPDQKQQQLKECFEKSWGIDFHTAAFLCRYFQSFLEIENRHCFVDDFINKSIKLNIQFPIDKELSSLSPNDGVIQATKFHPVVFETPYVRIMAGSAQPGEREPFHTHTWKSLLVVFEDATYFVEYANGSHELLHLSVGVYSLPPEDLYACTNCGNKKENCLRFEVKN